MCAPRFDLTCPTLITDFCVPGCRMLMIYICLSRESSEISVKRNHLSGGYGTRYRQVTFMTTKNFNAYQPALPLFTSTDLPCSSICVSIPRAYYLGEFFIRRYQYFRV